MINKLIDLIRSIYGEGYLPLHKAKLSYTDDKMVRSCFEPGGKTDCYGAQVAYFEHQISEYTGSAHVIATCSGLLRFMLLCLYPINLLTGVFRITPSRRLKMLWNRQKLYINIWTYLKLT